MSRRWLRNLERVISYPAPNLCQGSDEDHLITMGRAIFPGLVERPRGENGLRLWVEGDPTDSTPARKAAAMFQTLLGVLRAWRADAGELSEERRGGLGQGSVRDRTGNQWIAVGPAVVRATFGNEIERFAQDARKAIEASASLRNALWLNGRANRTAADYYMIHEYATIEYGGKKGVRDALGISRESQERLAASANNLSPIEGGRHAKYEGPVAWSLDHQREFASELLRLWIARPVSHRA
jgi:hypothetical protein